MRATKREITLQLLPLKTLNGVLSRSFVDEYIKPNKLMKKHQLYEKLIERGSIRRLPVLGPYSKREPYRPMKPIEFTNFKFYPIYLSDDAKFFDKKKMLISWIPLGVYIPTFLVYFNPWFWGNYVVMSLLFLRAIWKTIFNCLECTSVPTGLYINQEGNKILATLVGNALGERHDGFLDLKTGEVKNERAIELDLNTFRFFRENCIFEVTEEDLKKEMTKPEEKALQKRLFRFHQISGTKYVIDLEEMLKNPEWMGPDDVSIDLKKNKNQFYNDYIEAIADGKRIEMKGDQNNQK